LGDLEVDDQFDFHRQTGSQADKAAGAAGDYRHRAEAHRRQPALSDIGMEIGHCLHRIRRSFTRIESCLHNTHPFILNSLSASGWRNVAVSVSKLPAAAGGAQLSGKGKV
jgi:hypothetical protein